MPSPVAGRAGRAAGQGRRHCRGRRRDRARSKKARPRRSARSASRRRSCDQLRRRARRRRRAATTMRPSAEARWPPQDPTPPDPVAGGAPRGARTSCRPVGIKGTRQGRSPDQGRRARRGRSAKSARRSASAARRPSARAPAPSACRFRPRVAGERREERVKMTRMRQTIARRLKEAQNTAAMLTTFNDVDMSAVIDARSALQGSVREEARHPPRLHGLLREGGGARRQGRARGQRPHRRRRDRLSRLSRRLGRGVGAQGPGRAGRAQRRSA